MNAEQMTPLLKELTTELTEVEKAQLVRMVNEMPNPILRERASTLLRRLLIKYDTYKAYHECTTR